MALKDYQKTHRLEFTDAQWEELICLSFEPFEFEQGEWLTRGQWTALAHMALGKAQLLDAGRYDMGDEDDQDNKVWAEELRAIAKVILDYFQPGDMKP